MMGFDIIQYGGIGEWILFDMTRPMNVIAWRCMCRKREEMVELTAWISSSYFSLLF